jgi:hypothetical protein
MTCFFSKSRYNVCTMDESVSFYTILSSNIVPECCYGLLESYESSVRQIFLLIRASLVGLLIIY